MTNAFRRRACAALVPPRDSSFKTSFNEARDASSPGASPKRIPVSIVTPQRNTRTGTLVPASRKKGIACNCDSGIAATSRLTPHCAPSSPTPAPMPESKRLSVSNCESRVPRLAPRAERTANSLRRPIERVITRLATLAQVIRRTNPTAPRRISRIGRIFPTICWLRGSITKKIEPFSFGYSRVSRALMPSISARACVAEKPGASLPTTVSQCRLRRVMRSPVW